MCIDNKIDNYFNYQLRYFYPFTTPFNAFYRYSSLKNGTHNLQQTLV